MADFRTLLDTGGEDGADVCRVMSALTVGQYRVSIQASRAHYCSPRKTLPLDQYTEWEIAISEEDTEGFISLPFIEEWLDGDGIGAWVPTEVVQRIVDTLAEVECVRPASIPLPESRKVLVPESKSRRIRLIFGVD